jgi:hypothetical protein
MKKFLISAAALGLLMPVPALAQSIDGTWKADVSSAQMPAKPEVYQLDKGQYDCKTCTPAVSVKADGMDHAVSGSPYIDSVAIKVVDDHTISETDKKKGKVVTTSTSKVSSDGKTESFEFTDSSDTNAAPVSGKGMATRVAAGPAGAHAISGSWRITSYSTISDNGLTITYKMMGDSLMMTTPTGQSYMAKLDGTPAPYKGDPGITTVSVKKLAGGVIEETDLRDGKPVGVSKMTPGAKSLGVVYDNKLKGSSMSFSMKKM